MEEGDSFCSLRVWGLGRGSYFANGKATEARRNFRTLKTGGQKKSRLFRCTSIFTALLLHLYLILISDSAARMEERGDIFILNVEEAF